MIYLWTNGLREGTNWCFLEPKISESKFIKLMCREYFLNPSTLYRKSDGGKMQKCNINVHNFGLTASYECHEFRCYTL